VVVVAAAVVRTRIAVAVGIVIGEPEMLAAAETVAAVVWVEQIFVKKLFLK
jgi:hypothetical protein